jgi:hypothetical protein
LLHSAQECDFRDQKINAILFCISFRQDGSDIVRNYARRSILALSRDFPRAVAELLVGIDAKVLKMMEAELPEEVSEELARMKSRAQTLVLQPPTENGTNIRRSTGSFGGFQLYISAIF